MKKTILSINIAIIYCGITGCSTLSETTNKKIIDSYDVNTTKYQNLQDESINHYKQMQGEYIPIKKVSKSDDNSWLKQKKITIDARRSPVTLSNIIKAWNNEGFNISSDIDPEKYFFQGRINETNMENALTLISQAMNIDYDIDNAQKIIRIKPVSSKTWYLPMENIKISYSNNGLTGNANKNGSSSSGSSTSSTNSTNNNNNSDVTTATQTNVTVTSDFWKSLEKQLKDRLQSLQAVNQSKLQNMGVTGGFMPSPPPGLNFIPSQLGQPQQGLMNVGNNTQNESKIGLFSINPDSRSVTITGPSWLIREFDKEFKDLKETLDTNIVFETKLVFIQNNKANSEGFDFKSFANFAKDRYGFYYSNNIFGGVTISPGSNSVSTSLSTLSNPLLGIGSAADGLQVFNAYLEEIGNSYTIDSPIITTTPGIPGEFSKLKTLYYRVFNQDTASGGTGNAVVGIKATDVPVTTGIILKMLPTINADDKMQVSTFITFNQKIPSGKLPTYNLITTGNKTDQYNSEIILTEDIALSNRVSLKNGQLLIMGGQKEEILETNANGLPSFNADESSSPLSGLFGMQKTNIKKGFYILAIKANIIPK